MGNYSDTLRQRLSEAKSAKTAAPAMLTERVNVYLCEKCRHATVTVDRDDGVTPFMIGCEVESCDGHAHSSMYRAVTLLEPTLEWYRPSDAEKATLSPGARAHVENGGLLSRPITRTTAP